MRLLYYLTDLFVDTFGITRPTPVLRRRAALFILSLMILTIVGVVIAGIVLHQLMR